jgi:formylglycine-generating enzyme required for sulfatase activity
MPEWTKQPQAARPERSLVRFYITAGALLALLIFGAWFWKTWSVWWFDPAEAGRRQSEAAARLGLPVELTIDLPPSPSGHGAAGGDGMKLELVLIPAGRFRMGSPAEKAERSDDETQHRVMITRPFYIGKYEVTQEQWERVMGKNPSRFKGSKNPVAYVSWHDCQEFLRKLNETIPHPVATPRTPPLSRGERESERREGFRLPTEAEWEWACRAGTRTRFCCGDGEADLAAHAWFAANAGSTTHPVGTRRPNAWGLHDMHGNVWEWCSDWYGPYERKLKGLGWEADPPGPTTGSCRVLRGGSWYSYPADCRSAVRDKNLPATWNGRGGFRVVVVPAGHY